jgi:hypothetical protein
MITLGRGKTVFDRKIEPSQSNPEVFPTEIRHTFFEVVTWCYHSIPGDRFRSSELDPSEFLKVPPFDELGNEAWGQIKRESYQRAVSATNQSRSLHLRERGITISDVAVEQSKGKLLLWEPMETVTDGAAEASSRGFYDIEDAPPWDTWFLYSSGAIISWVPESSVQNAQAGIDANPVDCIRWIEWSDLSRILSADRVVRLPTSETMNLNSG